MKAWKALDNVCFVRDEFDNRWQPFPKLLLPNVTTSLGWSFSCFDPCLWYELSVCFPRPGSCIPRGKINILELHVHKIIDWCHTFKHDSSASAKLCYGPLYIWEDNNVYAGGTVINWRKQLHTSIQGCCELKGDHEQVQLRLVFTCGECEW